MAVRPDRVLPAARACRGARVCCVSVSAKEACAAAAVSAPCLGTAGESCANAARGVRGALRSLANLLTAKRLADICATQQPSEHTNRQRENHRRQSRRAAVHVGLIV